MSDNMADYYEALDDHRRDESLECATHKQNEYDCYLDWRDGKLTDKQRDTCVEVEPE